MVRLAISIAGFLASVQGTGENYCRAAVACFTSSIWPLKYTGPPKMKTHVGALRLRTNRINSFVEGFDVSLIMLLTSYNLGGWVL